MRSSIPAVPAHGPERVRWFEQLDAALTDEALRQLDHLEDEGWPASAVTEAVRGFGSWLGARAEAAIEVALLDTWWAV